MFDRCSNCGHDGHDGGAYPYQNGGNWTPLIDCQIRKSASIGHITGSNNSGSPDEKSEHEYGYIFEDLESSRQQRKVVLRTEVGHNSFLPDLQTSAQEPLSPTEDDVMMTEEELNTRVEALIKKFYSQMQRRKSIETLSPEEEHVMK